VEIITLTCSTYVFLRAEDAFRGADTSEIVNSFGISAPSRLRSPHISTAGEPAHRLLRGLLARPSYRGSGAGSCDNPPSLTTIPWRGLSLRPSWRTSPSASFFLLGTCAAGRGVRLSLTYEGSLNEDMRACASPARLTARGLEGNNGDSYASDIRTPTGSHSYCSCTHADVRAPLCDPRDLARPFPYRF